MWGHVVSAIELQFSHLDLSLDQIFEDSDVGGFSDSRLAFRLCWCLGALEGSDLYLKLFVELLQRLLLTDGILAVESRLLLVMI